MGIWEMRKFKWITILDRVELNTDRWDKLGYNTKFWNELLPFHTQIESVLISQVFRFILI